MSKENAKVTKLSLSAFIIILLIIIPALLYKNRNYRDNENKYTPSNSDKQQNTEESSSDGLISFSMGGSEITFNKPNGWDYWRRG